MAGKQDPDPISLWADNIHLILSHCQSTLHPHVLWVIYTSVPDLALIKYAAQHTQADCQHQSRWLCHHQHGHEICRVEDVGKTSPRFARLSCSREVLQFTGISEQAMASIWRYFGDRAIPFLVE